MNASLPEPPEFDGTDDERGGWLVTFSDLVLQLFAFVIVAVVLEAGAAPAGGAPQAVAERVPEVAIGPDPEVEWPIRSWPAAAPTPTESALPPTAVTEAPCPSKPAPVEPAEVLPEASRSIPDARLVSLGRYFDELLAAGGIADAAHVRVAEGEVLVSLGETVAFAPGSDSVPAAGIPLLDEVRSVARSMPDLAISVSGHTDDRPIRTARFPSNLHLSLARAGRVAHEIAAGDGSLRERVFATGYGAERPLASNATDAGRSKNRRVEIRLMPRG